MQKLILPDYYDGVRAHKKYIEITVHAFFLQFYPYVIKVRDQYAWDAPRILQQMEQGNVIDPLGLLSKMSPIELVKQLLTLGRKDQGFATISKVWYWYKKSEQKNYIFSDYLTSILKNTSCDIDCSYLPKDFVGFIELPTKDHEDASVLGLFVVIKNGSLLMTATTTKGVVYLNVDLQKDKKISEVIEASAYREYAKNGDCITKRKSEYTSFLSTVINTILFINNSDDLIEQCNIFASRRKKALAQKNIFTERTYFQLDLPKQQNYHVTSTFVKGHFRWQKYGEGYSKVKLIYIKPTVRHYGEKNNVIP